MSDPDNPNQLTSRDPTPVNHIQAEASVDTKQMSINTLAAMASLTSPASTAGESAEDASNPATPAEHSGDLLQVLHVSTTDEETVDVDDQNHVAVPHGEVSIECPMGSSDSSPTIPYQDAEATERLDWHERARRVAFDIPSSDADVFDEQAAQQSPKRTRSPRGHLFGSRDTVFRPRQDRNIEHISAENAQALFPPNSCVFVANLSAQESDDTLLKSVTEVFLRYGPCYPKVKRDLHNMPYAFVQYEKIDDSDRAIEYGRNIVINGRPCRTERAKARRTVFLSRITGGPISIAEARELLKHLGAIEKIWIPSDTESEIYSLPQGVWVTFAFFLDAFDAPQYFNNPKYRLEQIHVPEHRQTPNGQNSSLGSHSSSARNNHGPVIVDSNVERPGSIYVGNVPSHLTKEDFVESFRRYGNILTIEIVSRPLANGFRFRNHAFVEFSNENSAHRAKNSVSEIANCPVRIEVRGTNERYGRRVFVPTHSSGSPPGRGFVANHSNGSPRSLRNNGLRNGHANPSFRDDCILRGEAANVPIHVVDQIIGFNVQPQNMRPRVENEFLRPQINNMNNHNGANHLNGFNGNGHGPYAPGQRNENNMTQDPTWSPQYFGAFNQHQHPNQQFTQLPYPPPFPHEQYTQPPPQQQYPPSQQQYPPHFPQLLPQQFAPAFPPQFVPQFNPNPYSPQFIPQRNYSSEYNGPQNEHHASESSERAINGSSEQSNLQTTIPVANGSEMVPNSTPTIHVEVPVPTDDEQDPVKKDN